MRKSKSRLLPFLGLVAVLGLAVVTFVVLSGSNIGLDLRRRASGEQLAVTLANSSTKIQPNQAVTVDLLVNTQGKFVSGFQFSGTITGVNQDKTGIVISQLAGLNPIFSEVKKVGSDLSFKFVELAVLGGSAFTTHDQNQKLATFNLYPLQTGEIKLNIDQAKSGAMEFEKEFLTSNVGQKSYNIEVTSSTGGGNAPADAGIHRSCNQYCADSRECVTEFSCWYNRCRNPKNLTEEKCTEPVVVTKAAVTQTTKTTATTAKGGTTQPSPSPTPVTAVATVIITTASSSSQTATTSGIGSFGLGARPTSPSPKASVAASPAVKKLTPSPSPSPTVAPKAASGQSNLGLLIGAAVVMGILAFAAIIFFLKNRNSGYQN